MDFLVSIKGSKKIREYIYCLCNGIRREEDICDFLLRNHPEFTDSSLTRKSVRYHLSNLESTGLIYIKVNGRIVDLER